MTLSLGKLVPLFLVAILQSVSVRGTPVTRHHHNLGAYANPSSDLRKALEYIESLQQRGDEPESPTKDYEVDKVRLLVQLASLQDEDAQGRGDAEDWPENAPEIIRALLRVLVQNPPTERHSHKSRRPAAKPEGAASEYGDVVRPHKKYPLMFEDEENMRAGKRATEDLEEQYTPQSLANLRSMFGELTKLSGAQNEKQDEEDEEEDEVLKVRSPAYEDIAGGDEWVPLEEQLETEEMVKGSHEEFERGLLDSNEEPEMLESRASPGFEATAGPDDNTKSEYIWLNALEMTNQAQKRDLLEAQSGRRKLLNRPSLLDPRMIKQLLSAVSMKLQIPPEDLVGMLFMEETRKQQRLPDPQPVRKPSAPPRYRSRVIKYYNGRQPEVTVSDIPADVKTEDILKVLGLGNLANKNSNYFMKPRPYKTPVSTYFAPRRGGFPLSELHRAPTKRKDDYDDAVDEDEVATFLAAKLLTEYPETGSPDHKRSVDSLFPYEVYEEAMKDYFDQIDTGKSPPAKRDTQGKEETDMQQKTPTEMAMPEQTDQQIPESVTEGEKEHRAKLMGGM